MQHVSYDVRPDFSYTVHFEQRLEILNETGVRQAQNLSITTNVLPGGVVANDRKVNFSSIYLLKKNGEKIPAKSLPAPNNLPPAAAQNVHLFSFEGAAAGDTLVAIADVDQKKPLGPGMFVMTENFFLDMQIDDAEVSLRAPASMKLVFGVMLLAPPAGPNQQFRAKGLGAVKSVVSGNMRKWVWKYHPVSGEEYKIMMLHATSFPTMEEESNALARIRDTQPLPPMTASNHCPPMPALPQDGHAAVNAAAGILAREFQFNTRELVSVVDDWNIPSCVFLDGRPRLTAVELGLNQAFHGTKDWSVPYARIQQLKREFPKKAFVAFAEAQYWAQYAWNARGVGYANSVTDEGDRLFKERLGKAEQVLRDAKSYAANNPLWYDMMVNVQGAKGDIRGAIGTFREGATKFKTYYPLYYSIATFFEPKWYGNWESEENLTKWSVQNTRAVDGETMYARIYWNLVEEMESDGVPVFGPGHVSWPRMKQGFRDMMKRYPKSMWNLNNFARFACMAGDGNTYRELRKQIGDNVMDEAWKGPTTLDLCEAKYGS